MTYSSTLAMNRQRFGQRNQNTVSLQKAVRTVGPVSNTIILIVLACILGLLYLTQVTKTNAYGYKINDLQTQQATLAQQHDDLEVASARQQALERVASSDVAKSLVSVAPSATIRN
jgi:outer membrane murein-binding lipoprotein Lpp